MFKIYCDCGLSYDINRDKLGLNAISMGCNCCPNCEAKEYYNEWYNYECVLKIDVDPNQLTLFTNICLFCFLTQIVLYLI